MKRGRRLSNPVAEILRGSATGLGTGDERVTRWNGGRSVFVRRAATRAESSEGACVPPKDATCTAAQGRAVALVGRSASLRANVPPWRT
ncbi:MAG TPA: hypothetical protein VHM70_17340 [Polyangiaceae bacterium]|nr:hypothetical protein [Polyangiaceae bacterium]